MDQDYATPRSAILWMFENVFVVEIITLNNDQVSAPISWKTSCSYENRPVCPSTTTLIVYLVLFDPGKNYNP